MIRVIIFIVFIFIVWVLYASGFEKGRKIRISLIALVLCGFGFWFDGYDRREITNLVGLSDVENCGVVAEYSYRTNFDLTICVKNKAAKGILSRLTFAAVVSQCDNGVCSELQRVVRSLPVKIAPASQVNLEQNLSFDKLSPEHRALNANYESNLELSIEVLDTKATR